ncbi:uncharacterized protein PHALS_12768 [Plasmopara halstedii]|uniref:Uncharacterized protein n=1 Tax=Plasmopara halstedii TaxID=4781 RepID=A0A0N7L5V1_PLAHL|nr:uncharacterized protein PHALS_12768 [Plasmopara halstedii]CEG42499.1 hypothetical protein PHALS_12768 [Plasmopara halstedii]|eukprot:XP_024578868.1 hypothetical protein PHALS_12768 [Plasmopara halstedii]
MPSPRQWISPPNRKTTALSHLPTINTVTVIYCGSPEEMDTSHTEMKREKDISC